MAPCISFLYESMRGVKIEVILSTFCIPFFPEFDQYPQESYFPNDRDRLSIIRDRFVIVARSQAAEQVGGDDHVDRTHAAISHHEIADALVIAAEVFAKGVCRRLRQRIAGTTAA